MSMKIGVERDMDARPEDVWNLLVDTRRWSDWSPSIADVESSNVRIRNGTTGKIRTRLGVSFPFEVTEYDEGRYWAWNVARVGATGHRVESVPGGTRVTFEVPVYAIGYAPVCRRALKRLEKLVTP
jgi:uncharacterized protein YndB with AHSA1/START domain